MEFMNQLSNTHLDVLREIGNIGAGNAATSMASLINKRMNMQVPRVQIVEFEKVIELIGGPEELIVANYIRIRGEAPGTVYFILSKEEAEYFVREVTEDERFTLISGDKKPNDMAISTLCEVGNILAGSYLSALSDFTNINMQPSVPLLSVDMAGAILTAGLLKLSQVTDYALIIDTTITEQNKVDGIHSHFLLLPDPESFGKIFNNLGIDDDV